MAAPFQETSSQTELTVQPREIPIGADAFMLLENCIVNGPKLLSHRNFFESAALE